MSQDPVRIQTDAANSSPVAENVTSKALAARLEPFDSYWQAPEDIESGYSRFYEYYRANYLPHMPDDRAARILVISCGPGYLVNTLRENGYHDVTGIDSDSRKVEHATARCLQCSTAEVFPYLVDKQAHYDVIIPEQELNHLTLDEMLEFLRLCHDALRDNGYVLVYGLNGANPMVGSENLSHNIDHFNTFTEYSLRQVLELSGFHDIRVMPLKLYVFWKNPLNYVGLAVTSLYELFCRAMFKLYGKDVTILSKKLAALGRK
jgi:2-polyprenyl-3-methyl-5-hydroxy-6-metoxy-1,4-benzoquinol methylase